MKKIPRVFPLRFWVPFFLLASVYTTVNAEVAFAFQAIDGGRVVYSEKKTRQSYRLALSSYKKTNNRWHAEKEYRLAGQLSRQTVEFAKNYSAQEIFNLYLGQLKSATSSAILQEAFYCEARSCGSSNVWANNHFNVRQLYGLDQYQHYGVYIWQQDASAPQQYITLYSVRRGNGRVFAQLEVFIPNEPLINKPLNTQSMFKQLTDIGYVVLATGIANQKPVLDSNYINTIKTVLENEQKRFAIVGHAYSANTQAQRQTQADTIAQEIYQQLINAGVAKEKLSVYAVGGLAPRETYPGDIRVELLLLPDQ